jgi:hypothetical protein
MSTPSFTNYSFFLLASLGLLTNCKKVCDNEDAPTYALTRGQNEWGKSFVKNDVWRFRNANGYVRTYRVTRAETLSQGGGGGKSSLCSTYFDEYFLAEVERTDSTADAFGGKIILQMSPANATNNKPFSARVLMGIPVFELPIDQVEDGRLTLAPATFGGRTYPAVMGSTYNPVSPPVPRPTFAARLFLTKAEGVVRFEEFGGTVWNRL